MPEGGAGAVRNVDSIGNDLEHRSGVFGRQRLRRKELNRGQKTYLSAA